MLVSRRRTVCVWTRHTQTLTNNGQWACALLNNVLLFSAHSSALAFTLRLRLAGSSNIDSAWFCLPIKVNLIVCLICLFFYSLFFFSFLRLHGRLMHRTIAAQVSLTGMKVTMNQPTTASAQRIVTKKTWMWYDIHRNDGVEAFVYGGFAQWSTLPHTSATICRLFRAEAANRQWLESIASGNGNPWKHPFAIVFMLCFLVFFLFY